MKKILIALSIILSSCNSTKYISVLAANEEVGIAKELNLVSSKNLFFVDAYLNDKKCKLLVDTGANVSVLDINQAKKYGFTYRAKEATVVGIGGHSLRYSVYDTRLITKSGKKILLRFSGSDMKEVFDAMSDDGIYVVGIIGSDFLMNNKAIIDYKTKTLHLY